MLRYVSSRSGIHTVQDTELGVEKTFTNAELYAELKATGSIAGLFFDSDGNIWSVLGFKIVDAYYMNGETAPTQEESISAPISEEPASEPVVEEPVAVDGPVMAEQPDTDFRDEPAGPIDTTPKTGYMYLGMVDDLHRVKDLSDGVVDELSDTELRNALSQVGQIHGIYFDGDDNIRALTGQIIVRAVEEATAEEFVDVSTEELVESSSEEPAEPTDPKYQYTYMTGRDNVHKVKDLSTGEVEECDDATLRQAYNAGLIEGLVMYDDGSIWDEFGVLRVDGITVGSSKNNSNLHSAKKEKNDEFYTQLPDIEKELSRYPDSAFKDKIIYCPTDVAVNTGSILQSNFVKYFQMHAHRLQFKKLIATCLVQKAAGVGEDVEHVQNCYVLERVVVPLSQRNVYSKVHGTGANNPVVGEVDDFGIKYESQDGSKHPVPYHIVNQAVTEPLGRLKLVKMYFDGYDVNTGDAIVSETPTGKKWFFDGHELEIKWCRQHPDGTIEPLPLECYFFNKIGVIDDFGILPKDSAGNYCLENVAGGVVCLYPPEYYDFKESEYIEYSWHCPVDSSKHGGSGDFRSEYCSRILADCDIVVTNPPFSLFRDFMGWLAPSGKQFIVMSNMNAVTYKEIFPLIKDKRLFPGFGFNISVVYQTPYPNMLEDNRKYVIKHGYDPDKGFIKTPAICWLTNVDISKRHELLVGLSKSEYEQRGVVYHKYDNYDAINVDKVSQIPMDYEGVMGVPITFLDKYNPDQFEIVAFRKGDDGNDLVFTTERERVQPYFRILVRRHHLV